MGENTFQVIYNGKVEKETTIPVQEIERDLKDRQNESNIAYVNEEGTAMMQVRHELINVGQTIAQIKYTTTAKVTEYGTVKIVQFKQEISSRGEEVWYYKNSTGTFEGTLDEAKLAFPEEIFSGLNVPEPKYENHPELGRIPILANTQPVQWKVHDEFDGEKAGGPTTWDKWADVTQTTLDVIGLVPVIGEFADLANGVISLARGNYGDAALSFAAMIPFIGTGATVVKQARKLKKAAKLNKKTTEGVYDFIVKNTDEVDNYIGKSQNVFTRITQHFNPKRGKLASKTLEKGSLFHKMKGATDYQMEMVENWLIIKKYTKNWQSLKKTGKLKTLLNKRNPVGGRFDLKTEAGVKKFLKEAEKIIDKFPGLKESLKSSF